MSIIGVGKLWPVGQTWLITCFLYGQWAKNRFYIEKMFVAHENYMKSNFSVMDELECSHLFIYILPIAVFMMQWQRWIVVKDRMACKSWNIYSLVLYGQVFWPSIYTSHTESSLIWYKELEPECKSRYFFFHQENLLQKNVSNVLSDIVDLSASSLSHCRLLSAFG